VSERVYYASTSRGCRLLLANSVRSARSEVQREVGTFEEVTEVRKATQDDISWVRAMGGYVPVIVEPAQ